MVAWQRRRILRLAIVTMGGLAVGALIIGVGGRSSATLTAAQATSLSAMGNLSGTVTAARPFKAAQVYLRNVDKRIMYMVYTNAGQFRSVALFPGNYEVRVIAKGLASDVQKLVVKTGDNPKISVALRDAASGPAEADTLANLETLSDNRVKVSFDSYDNIYPPGPGKACELARTSCWVREGVLTARETAAHTVCVRLGVHERRALGCNSKPER